MRRRDFITGIAGSAAAWTHAAQAQKIPRIGVLLVNNAEPMGPKSAAGRADAAHRRTALCSAGLGSSRPYLQELQAFGYVDGKTVAIEHRDAEGKYERLPELAAELVRANPDVIFSFGGKQAPILKRATASIPIVVVVATIPLQPGSWRASRGRVGMSRA